MVPTFVMKAGINKKKKAPSLIQFSCNSVSLGWSTFLTIKKMTQWIFFWGWWLCLRNKGLLTETTTALKRWTFIKMGIVFHQLLGEKKKAFYSQMRGEREREYVTLLWAYSCMRTKNNDISSCIKTRWRLCVPFDVVATWKK